MHSTGRNSSLSPVQQNVIQRPSLYVQHMCVHGRALRFLQQPHVVGDESLQERARVVSLDLQEGPVWERAAHEPPRAIVDRALAVLLAVVVAP